MTDSTVQHADKLYDEHKFREVLDYLTQYSDTQDQELLWRLIRAYYRVGQQSSDQQENKRLADEATKLSERALAINSEHFFCQKVNERDTP